MNVLCIINLHFLAKSTVLCFSLKEGRSAMTSFLDICYGYNAGVIGTIYYYLDANTFGMVPTWHYGILRGYCNCYLIIMYECL